jgi:hypothetical protein
MNSAQGGSERPETSGRGNRISRTALHLVSATFLSALAGCSSSQGGPPPPPVGSAQLEEVPGQSPANVVEIQAVSAGPFNPSYWQSNTLNWVPDVRDPLFASQPGPNQNIYSPWALEQANGWRMFYGGWDGSDTPNDRVYSVTTPDFISFGNRILVIDHGAFQHVNNMNVHQLPDGSFHMICGVFPDALGLDKIAYFSSSDGITWNGATEPYSAQLSDMISIRNDPVCETTDYNGGNVLLRDNGIWDLFYSSGIFAANGVSRATTINPPTFEFVQTALSSSRYANDVRLFQSGGQNWYLMALYVEEITHIPPPTLTYSLSSDGIHFGPEQPLFGGAYAEDQYLTTPAFVTKGNQILGVLYGGNATDLLNPADQIFARWLQKRVILTDSSGVQHFAQGGYGPDRQWFLLPLGSSIEGDLIVYSEDGMTQIGSGKVTVNAGKPYRLVLN